MPWYDSSKSKSIVREYRNRSEMDRDVAKAADHGWLVVSTSELSQRSGCMRFLTLGLFTLFFKPKPHILVTYKRD